MHPLQNQFVSCSLGFSTSGCSHLAGQVGYSTETGGLDPSLFVGDVIHQ